MRKGLQERYARFDARFPLDEVYLALPRAIRNDAYLYLLALNGNQRATEADSKVPLQIAQQIARLMGLNAEKVINALANVLKDGEPRVLRRTSTHVELLKYDKWQDTPEQIAELKLKRSEAGRLGGLSKAGKEVASAKANAVADAKQTPKQNLAEGMPKQNLAETEREGETEIRNASKKATSVVREALTDAIQNGHTNDLALQLAKRVVDDVLKRDLSPLEVALCEQFVAEYAYLGVDDVVERMKSQLEWGKQQKLDPPSSLAWFTQSLRIENGHRADQGQAKAWRPPPVAGDLSRLNS